MKIIITESQYKKLLSTKKIKPKIIRGKFFHKGKIKEQVQNQLTQNQKLAQQQGFGPVSKEYADELARTNKIRPPDFSKPTLDLTNPNDVRTLPNYTPQDKIKDPRYVEPLSKTSVFVKGKYKDKLPPQTNDYYWEIGKGWVAKTVANVGSWRDVPPGYLPSEYESALAWEKRRKETTRKPNEKSAESTLINKPVSSGENPFYNKDYPLGITTSNKQLHKNLQDKYYQSQKDKTMNAPSSPDIGYETRRKFELSPLLQKEKENYIVKLNEIFGAYKPPKVKEDTSTRDAWLDFLSIVALALPVAREISLLIRGGIGLYKATNAYEEDKIIKAGAELLFAFFPEISSVAKNANLLNLIKLGGENPTLGRYLQNNAERMFQAVASGMVTKLEQYLPQIIATKGEEFAVNLMKKYTDRLLIDPISVKNLKNVEDVV